MFTQSRTGVIFKSKSIWKINENMRCISSYLLVSGGEGFVWESLLLYSCQLDAMSDTSECRPVSQYKAKNKKEWTMANTSENVKIFGLKPQRKLLPNLPWNSFVLAYDHMNVWKWVIRLRELPLFIGKTCKKKNSF